MLRRSAAGAGSAPTKSPVRSSSLEPLEIRTMFNMAPVEADFAAWREQTYQLAETTETLDGQWAMATPVEASRLVGQADQGVLLVGADLARQQTGLDGSGYTIAVLDTGIDYTHPDLVAAYAGGYDFVDNDADPRDLNGHGTHVAGIIAGRGTNFPGIAPGARVLSLRVLDANGSGNFGDVYDALQWVIDHRQQYNIVAVNMSLGSGNYSSNPFQYLEPKLQSLVGSNVFVAAASGNGFYTVGSQQGLSYPAVSSSVVSVGAVWDANVGSASWSSGARDYTTAADRVTSFTQRNAELDILAPGAMITSTYMNHAYASMAGTSMASPIVAASAALIRQALDVRGQGNLATQSHILSLMQSTGVSLVDGDDENDNVANTGLALKRLNLLAAIQSIPSGGDSGGGGGGGGGATPHTLDSVGFFAPSGSQFFLKNSLSQGLSDAAFRFGPGGNAWTPLVGDWNGDGSQTVGFFYSTTSSWFLRNSNSGGLSDATFNYGPAGNQWKPLVGDWNGDGSESVGFYDPTTSTFFLKNDLSQGLSDVVFKFGPANSNWKVLTGDWNGDGVTSVGFFDPATSTFYLKNGLSQGLSDVVFNYGPAGANWTPLVGDWNADGTQTVGFYNPGSSTFFLRNSLSQGLSDVTFSYGPAGANWTPLVGSWTGAQTTSAGATSLETTAAPSQGADWLFARLDSSSISAPFAGTQGAPGSPALVPVAPTSAGPLAPVTAAFDQLYGQVDLGDHLPCFDGDQEPLATHVDDVLAAESDDVSAANWAQLWGLM